ncbi:MAG: hypothetical protein N2202_09940 [Proteobacteria bacterium]|nr:hypothetical protein [Pseudomonadota bacterium]
MEGRKILGNLVFISVFVVISLMMTCVVKGGNNLSSKPIEDVLKEHTDKLMSIPGVIGTAQGICDGKPCIKVYLREKTPALEQKIPDNIEGYPVSIEEIGEIRAF